VASGEPQPGPGSARTRTARALRAGLWMGAGAAVALALLAGAALLALPLLEQRPELAAGWLSEQLGRRVRLEQVEITWRGGAPLVRLRGVELGSAGDGGVLALDAAEVRVDALGSLRAGAVRPRAITVRGAELAVTRRPAGALAISGFGRDAATGAADAIGLALASLPRGAVLGLEEARVTLHGFLAAAGSAASITLAPVSVHLRAGGGGLRLAGTAAAPASPRTPLRFSLRVADASPASLATAELSLSTRGLPLSALPAGLLPERLDGLLRLDLNGSMDAGAVAAMRGTLGIERIRLDGSPEPLPVEGVQALVDFARRPGGWTLSLLRLQARRGGRLSPPTRVRVEGEDGTRGRYRLALDHLPLAELLPLLAHAGLPPRLGQAMQGWVTPRGRLEDVQVQLVAGDGGLRAQQLAARLRDVVLRSPAGAVRLGPAGARLTLQGSAGHLELAPVPLHLGPASDAVTVAAGGSLRWHLDAAHLNVDDIHLELVDEASGASITGSMALPLAPQAPLRVDLAANGPGFDAARIAQRAAATRLPEKVARWIEQAVLAGRVTALTARLAGTPQQLARLEGTVQLAAALEEVSLRFEPDWPQLTGLAGAITLDGRALGFRVDRGLAAEAQIEHARGGIADVLAGERAVSVSGRASGLTQQGAAYLAATPVGERFAGLLQQLDARGRAALDLELRIPLGPPRSEVAGTVRLDDNTLRLPALRSALDAVNGSIAFDREGVRTGELEARYLGRRITARVDGTREGRERTLLTIDGTTDPGALVRHLYDVGALDSGDPQALPLLSRLDGSAHWQVRVDVPHREALAGAGIALEVRSDLEGMALALPAPLGKPAAARRPLEVATRLTGEGPRRFRVRYGEHSALLEMAPGEAGGGFELRRGALRFDGEAELPAEPGLAVRGQVAEISVDQWVDLIAEISLDAAVLPLGKVREVDLAAARVVTLGAQFRAVRVRAARPEGGDWRLGIDGDGIEGSIRIPVPVGREPVDARFARLHLAPLHQAPAPQPGASPAPRARPLDPRTLPDAQIVAEQLRYDDVELGLSKITLRRRDDGVELSELFALNEAFELRGTGAWRVDGERTRSEFSLRIHSADFGRMTRALGYGESGIEGGVSDIALEAHWQGSPFDFGLDRVHGALDFRAAGGRLRDMEPGASGRVFGLLNVTVLPRRLLRLDFADLFQEGVRYDRVEGSVRLDGGNAHLENVTMHTEAARIDLSGRVGLVAQDYDQVLTVTPKLSASLPLAPIWLAEKFLNRKLIDPAFSYRYMITGPWDDPKIERDRVEAVPTDAG